MNKYEKKERKSYYQRLKNALGKVPEVVDRMDNKKLRQFVELIESTAPPVAL